MLKIQINTRMCFLHSSSARDLFNLPISKKISLFGAVSPLDDENKGFDLLQQALEFLPSSYELVVFGAEAPSKMPKIPQKATFLGRIHDNYSLRALYSAADLIVVPSRSESFSLVAAEAMSCARPVVAFRSTGLVDVVDHGLNGYLAKPFDVQDFATSVWSWIYRKEIWIWRRAKRW